MIKKCLLLFFIFVCLLFCSSCKNDSYQKSLKISIWGAKTQIDTFSGLIRDFEKQNPDIKVDIIHIPQNYFQKIHLLIASNLTPDIVMINNINGKLYIENNIFEPLDKYFDDEISKDMFYSASVFPFVYKEQLYAIPRDVSNMAIFYNKKLFNEKNVEYPNENWSLNDLLSIAQKLTTKDTLASIEEVLK